MVELPENNYVERVGMELDEFENVVADGKPGETISLRVARGQAAGKWFPCLFCAWLSLTVEKDHCPKTLAGQNTSTAGAIRAGIQLFSLFVAVTGAFWWFVFR